MGLQIRKLIGLGLVGGMVLKKFGSMLLNMPRQMLRTAFKIQKEIVYFPFRIITTFYRLLFRPNMTCNSPKTLQETSKVEASKRESHCEKSVKIIELEPVFSYHKCVKANPDLEWDSPCHKAIQVMLGLRQESPHKSKTSSCLQPKSIKTAESANKSNRNKDIEDDDDDDFIMPEFPRGSDFVRYSEIVTRKSLILIEDLTNFAKSRRSPDGEPSISKFSQSKEENLVHESNLNGIDSPFNKLSDENFEAMKSLKSRHHKEKLNQTYSSSAKCISTEAIQTIKKVIREFDYREKGSDIRNNSQNSKHAKNNRSSRIINQETSGAESTLHNAQQVLNASLELLRSLIDMVTQEIISLKHKIASTNSKIEDVLGSSIVLFEELSHINERFNRLINLSNKITDLQRELSEGHKLFQEVEADRNDMKLKLQALERMIKEEEEYLGDVSCESGYDEYEIRATSPYKQDYL